MNVDGHFTRGLNIKRLPPNPYVEEPLSGDFFKLLEGGKRGRDDPGLPLLLLERPSEFAGLLSDTTEGVT